MKISVLGDSISKGVVFDGLSSGYRQLGDNYVALLQRRFGFEVDNLSKFGCTITKALRLLAFHKDRVARSSYAVVEYGGNDSDFKWEEVSRDPEAVHHPLTDRDLFREEYGRMVDAIKGLGATPILLNLPPIDAGRYFERISQGRSKENILRYLGGDVQYIYRWHESYNMEIQMIAQEKGVPLIDIRSAFLLDRDSRRLICDDGIHPSEEGHQLIAASIGRKIAEAS